MVDAGAAVIAHGPVETARAIVSLLRDGESTEAMALRSKKMARPTATREIACLALNLLAPVKEAPCRMTA
jgi:UDP-N-acetylglucosamine:LPS N-acetylglucosamine transferase